MERSRSFSLSRKQENELVWSNKKGKDSHHAIKENSLTHPRRSTYPPKLSFKDKLVAEILGAYSQAFSFSDQMEAESDLNEEIEEVREDLASVSLLKETKQHIKASWAKALIVKVFGKTVGYNFPHLKLMGLWKPVWRVDTVDLGRDFFLLRFSIMEDLEMVFK